MKKLALVLTSLAVVAFAQQGKVARDAGVVVAPKPPPDAGTPEPVRVSPDVEKLRKEVTELRARVVDLELKASKADVLAADVEKLRGKLDTLRADVDAAEERRTAAEREVATRKAQTAQATSTVTTVLQQLSLGNTSNVDLWLRGAEQQYSGNASKLISLARSALAQGDLNAARQYLNLAVLEAGP
jgi:outer membrane murein-binding lipoprotein Lpp